jgi:hypothetical protein
MVVGARRWAALSLAIGALLASHAASAETCYTVGTWNLEHFKAGKVRGFPELVGANGLPPRTDAQLDLLAETIRDKVDAKILVLNETNGRSGKATSAELEDLIARLGPSWRYAIAKSGSAQRVAVIWDSAFATEIARLEIAVPVTKVADGSESSDIFVRDPLAVYFRLVENGQPRNDLLVVGLHLASGQHFVNNHDAAMDRVRAEMRALCSPSSIERQIEGLS